MPAASRTSLLPAWAIAYNALVWGLSWLPLQHLQGQGLHPLWSTALMYSLPMLSLLLWRPQLLREFAGQRDLWWLLLASGLTNACFNWAVATGDVIRVVLLFYLMPVWTVFLAWWLLDERPTRSALLRVVLALLGLIALLVPYGAGGEDLITRTLGLARGITIGELIVSPAGMVRAIVVFLLALGVFHLVKRWLDNRYLPTTALDPGMRASVVSLFGYAGIVAAVAMALAAIGVGLERIAWIASALSVGIGFGLQAIVQNFISGLILLAERPVKVGDWVVVGDAEGDIRRINVRATEIQTGDRTTVLVPNSELITKAVRNRTYADAQGLVKIVLPMPLATDADLVRELVLDVFRGHPGMLEAPAPSVLIDGISDKGQVMFNATGFVASPRQAAGVRSALLFEILRRLRQLEIRMI